MLSCVPGSESPEETFRAVADRVDQDEPVPQDITGQASDLADNSIDLSLATARHDLSLTGELSAETPQGRSQGARQKRFGFDAGVVRGSIVRKLRSIGREDIATPIDFCHREAVYKRCVGCRHVRTFYNRCERFYCPICAARLARDRRESVAYWSKLVCQPKHVVLTVASVPHITKAYVRRFKDDFRKLRNQVWAKKGAPVWKATAITPCKPSIEPMPGLKRKRGKLSPWRGRKVGTFSSPWRGGFWSLDLTWSLAGFHLHFHGIVDADFIDRDELERQWAKLRGQDMAVVRVYDAREKDYKAEVCKYVCDGTQIALWPAEVIAEMIDSLSEERCFDTFGTLYKQRSEWTAFKDEIHADRNICACGCAQWQFFNESEWEWQQVKNDLAPPAPVARPRVEHHPVLFALPTIAPR